MYNEVNDEPAIIFKDPDKQRKDEEELSKISKTNDASESAKENKEYLILYVVDNEDVLTSDFIFLEGKSAAIEFVKDLVESFGDGVDYESSYVCVENLRLDQRITLRQFITIVNKILTDPIPIEFDSEDES